MAVDGPVTRRSRDVVLVEEVNHPMHRIKDRAIRVVLLAAVLIHQVVCRRVQERSPTVFIAWGARPRFACGRSTGTAVRMLSPLISRRNPRDKVGRRSEEEGGHGGGWLARQLDCWA